MNGINFTSLNNFDWRTTSLQSSSKSNNSIGATERGTAGNTVKDTAVFSASEGDSSINLDFRNMTYAERKAAAEHLYSEGKISFDEMCSLSVVDSMTLDLKIPPEYSSDSTVKYNFIEMFTQRMSFLDELGGYDAIVARYKELIETLKQISDVQA